MEKNLLKRSLVVLVMASVMFILILLSSNKIYALGIQVPFELIYGGVITGMIGIPLFIVNKTPFKYILFTPGILLLLLFVLRSDPYN